MITDHYRRIYIRTIGRWATTWTSPPAGADVANIFARPPFKPACGSYAPLAGRSRRRSHRGGEEVRRRIVALRAAELRCLGGCTLREIAEEVGRSVSIVGRWLHDMPALGSRQDLADVDEMRERSRPGYAAYVERILAYERAARAARQAGDEVPEYDPEDNPYPV